MKRADGGVVGGEQVDEGTRGFKRLVWEGLTGIRARAHE